MADWQEKDHRLAQPVALLHQPSLREAQRDAIAYDDVIETANINNGKSFFEFPRKQLIGQAWLGYS